jgi:hypothetical protein
MLAAMSRHVARGHVVVQQRAVDVGSLRLTLAALWMTVVASVHTSAWSASDMPSQLGQGQVPPGTDHLRQAWTWMAERAGQSVGGG